MEDETRLDRVLGNDKSPAIRPLPPSLARNTNGLSLAIARNIFKAWVDNGLFFKAPERE